MDDRNCVAGRRWQARQPRPPAGLGWAGVCAMRAWSWLSSKAILLGRMLEVGRAVGVESETGAGVTSMGGADWAKLSGMLRDASKGKGNFGIGSGTAEQAGAMGKAWVGEGYKVASDGKTLVSSDGLRQFRPPSFKSNLGKTQANLERGFEPMGQWQGNAHLDIE
jgi:hypothetical protein